MAIGQRYCFCPSVRWWNIIDSCFIWSILSKILDSPVQNFGFTWNIVMFNTILNLWCSYGISVLDELYLFSLSNQLSVDLHVLIMVRNHLLLRDTEFLCMAKCSKDRCEPRWTVYWLNKHNLLIQCSYLYPSDLWFNIQGWYHFILKQHHLVCTMVGAGVENNERAVIQLHFDFPCDVDLNHHHQSWEQASQPNIFGTSFLTF